MNRWMDERRVEGVVLRSTPFKENDRILNVFTPDQGIISFYVRGLSKTKPHGVNLNTPLSRGEFVLKKGKSDLFLFLDGTILDFHLPLRRSYHHLMVGGKILNALLKTQMPGKNSQALYQLLIKFLKKLSDAEHPDTFWITFQIKLLKHEGLLAISKECLQCSAPASYIVNGESRCTLCSQGEGFLFNEGDWAQLVTLFHIRTFDPLLTLTLPLSLKEGVNTYFQTTIML